MPIVETHNSLVGLNSLAPPVRGAETYTGGLAYRSDGTVGGARDAWGVGVAGTARPATGLALARNASWLGLRDVTDGASVPSRSGAFAASRFPLGTRGGGARRPAVRMTGEA